MFKTKKKTHQMEDKDYINNLLIKNNNKKMNKLKKYLRD